MKTIIFTRCLAESMTKFVAMKRIQGFKYEAGAIRLSYFDRFLTEYNISSMILTPEQLKDYQGV